MPARDSEPLVPARPRILVVEDDGIILAALEHILQLSNFHVVGGLISGEEAVAAVDALQPDLILMDVHLAGKMDGIEAARQIRATYDIPVIYLTGIDDEATLSRAVSTGPYGYLAKPLAPRELRRAIEVALVKHGTQRELARREAHYRRMFQAAAVSLWEEDIDDLLAHMDELRRQGVSDFRSYLAEHPEWVEQATGWIRVIDVNEMTVRMYGAATKEELLGPRHLTAPEALPGFRDIILAIAEQRAYIEFESVALTLTGQKKHVLIRVTLPQDRTRNSTMLTSITDITERVHAEETLRGLHEQVRHHAEDLERRVADRTRELSTLYAVSEVASDALDPATMLRRSLERVLGAVRSSAGFIHLLEGPSTTATGTAVALGHRMAVAQGVSPGMLEWIERLPANAGILTWIIANDAPLVLDDITSAPGLQGEDRLPPHRYIGMPMRAGGRTVGVLSVLREGHQPLFTHEEVALLTSVADQVGAVVESARLRHRAEQSAVVEERHRLARELHDSVTQSLYSLTLLAEGGRRLAVADRLADPSAYFADLREISLQCLKEMRLLIYELRATGLDKQGAIASIQQRLDAVENRSGLDARLLVDGDLQLSGIVEESLAGIAHEALNNALKHASATSLLVHIRPAQTEGVELVISDNGCGFDPTDPRKLGGMGLTTMRERAERVGGTLAIHSGSASGTTVIATFPPVHAGAPLPSFMIKER